MMAADSLCFIVPSGVSFRRPLMCHRVCQANASALHVTQQAATLCHVQTPDLELARSMAVVVFAEAVTAGSKAPPESQGPEGKRRAKTKGKIKGRGTWPLEDPVCTWGWRGTHHEVAACRVSAPCRIGVGEVVCFTRWVATTLDGAAP